MTREQAIYTLAAIATVLENPEVEKKYREQFGAYGAQKLHEAETALVEEFGLDYIRPR